MARIAVVGAGAWGTALACHLARLEHAVTMWAYEPEVAEEIATRHTNSPYLPDVSLPETIRASVDPRQVAASADVVILVPPSSHLRAVSTLVAPGVLRDAIVVVATKGIEERTLKLMSMVLEETMPGLEAERLAFLSGPTFAREVAAGLPTDVVVASRGMIAARKVQDLIHSATLRTYTGADPLTFLGLAGVGDLVLTCTGDLSRNRTLGMRVAEGTDPAGYLAQQRSVAEGFSTAAAAYDLARKVGVDMPVTEQVYHVLHRGRPLLEAVRQLLERGYKEELHGIRGS